MLTPYDWQENDLAYLREHKYTGLLAIEPGGTKTYISTMVMNELQPEITLIIAPEPTFKTPERNWPATVKMLTGKEVKRIGNSTKQQVNNLLGLELGEPGVYITTPQFFARKSTNTQLWRGDLIIVDEIHQICTAKSNGQRKLSGYSPSDPEPISMRFPHRLALSGTPFRQNFENAWGTMRFLWPDLNKRGEVAHDNFWVWCQDRMESEEIVTGFSWVPLYGNQSPAGTRTKVIDGVLHYGEVTKITKFKTESEPGKLFSEMPCVVIHKRRERCCEYHPKGFLDLEKPQEIERVVDLTAKQKKAIRELEDHYMTYLDDHPFVVELSITQQQRIRQLCLGEAKVEYYMGEKDGEPVEKTRLEFPIDTVSPFLDEVLHILDELDEDEPVIIFLDSQRFARVLTERLNGENYSTQEYSGKTKAELSGFGSDYQVLVAVTSAIGTGTDGLQEKCNTEIWLEVPVSLTMETQSQARLDRMGARKQVQRYIVKDSDGYAEGRISANLEKKLSNNKSIRREVSV